MAPALSAPDPQVLPARQCGFRSRLTAQVFLLVRRHAVIACAVVMLLASRAEGNQKVSGSAAPRDPQAVTVLQEAVRSLAGGMSLSDVTLAGGAERYVGGESQTGTVTIRATMTGRTRLDLVFPSGVYSEVREVSPSSPAGMWLGKNGAQHAIPLHNLMADPTWWTPALLVSRLLANGNYSVAGVTREMRGGAAVLHISTAQQLDGTDAKFGSLIEHLSQVDLYLDPSTFLPAIVAFDQHPDNDATIDIPVEIRFSNYQNKGGMNIPLRIAEYVNGRLFLNLDIQTVQLNAGLSSSAFQLP